MIKPSKPNKAKYTVFLITLLYGINNFADSKSSFPTDFKLGMPLDCNYGKNCYIQNYVDLNSSVGYKDYKCGYLSYNDHKGTDFRLLDYKQMTSGIKVIAVADGTVTATRTKEKDFAYIELGKTSVDKKECGNGIVINHNNGFTTQYCHLLKNSIVVTEGQKIKKGDKLGYVGMSGQTEFPHLHITIKFNDEIIDPFTGFNPQQEYICSNSKNTTTSTNNVFKPLWERDVYEKLEYIPTAILNFYATDQIPDKLAARAGKFREDKLSRKSDKIIFWSDVMGVNKKDRIVFELEDENGNNVFKSVQKVQKKYVLYFLYSGKKLQTENNLKKGKYQAKISLYRKKTKIVSKIKTIEII